MTKPVILLMGPTASGKTQFALELAAECPLEIISVDSAMIYKSMDIGTGKPSAEELAHAPHHLVDILDPTQNYSAAEFCHDAVRLINDIHQRDKIPLFVGGTMLYFNALVNGLAELPEGENIIRQQLEKDRQTVGLEKLYQRLTEIDPIAATRIHPNDPQRILRALEVFLISGQPISNFWQQQNNFLTEYSVTQLAIFPEQRDLLHKAIAERFQTMLANGFIDEVELLMNRGDLDLTYPSMRCVGYRQIWQYLAGEYDKKTMKEKAIAATRQLAKRQLTWLRHWENIQIFADVKTIKPIIKSLC